MILRVISFLHRSNTLIIIISANTMHIGEISNIEQRLIDLSLAVFFFRKENNIRRVENK